MHNNTILQRRNPTHRRRHTPRKRRRLRKPRRQTTINRLMANHTPEPTLHKHVSLRKRNQRHMTAHTPITTTTVRNHRTSIRVHRKTRINLPTAKPRNPTVHRIKNLIRPRRLKPTQTSRTHATNKRIINMTMPTNTLIMLPTQATRRNTITTPRNRTTLN